MKHKKQVRFFAIALAGVLLLSGCSSFLNREYSASGPHSAAYYGGDDGTVLRIENYQNLVNALLMLVSDRATEATIWFYPSGDYPNASEAMARACAEVQQDTPLGAYTVDYLSYTQDDISSNYSVLHLAIGYRRSTAQVNAIVHATDVSVLYDLLPAAADRGDRVLAVQVNALDQSREEIAAAVAQTQLAWYAAKAFPADGTEEGQGAPAISALPADVMPWQVSFYPPEGDSCIVEVLLKAD